MPDFINTIERALIDQLRTDFPDWHVFGQYPEAVDVKYPCFIVEQFANGLEEAMMGQKMTFGGSEKKGELYGMAFNIHAMLDKDSSMSITPDGGSSTEVYKQRRLLNYLMLNCANVLMDCDFSSTATQVLQRTFTGFSDIGWNPERETWHATSGMILVFLRIFSRNINIQNLINQP